MKTLFSILSIFLLGNFSATAMDTPVFPAKGMEGIYEYSAPEAPYEYQKGDLELKKVDKKWTAKVKIGSQSLTARDVKVEKNNVEFKVYVEGTSVTIKLTHKDDQLTGTANSYEGVMKIVAKRKKKEVKKQE